MADTIAMADNSTRPMGLEDINRLFLKKNVVFKGKKNTYEIQAENHIGSGGESQVYLAKCQTTGEQVVAKIYDNFADNPENKSNRKMVIKFLEENFEYKKTHIMPLLDCGTIDMESNDGEDFYRRPLDIIPYCKNGELKHCEYRILKNKVIPEVLCALNLLHSNNLVHRDIKPNNIYMYNGEIVLADFGTTSQILNKQSASKTETRRGTPGYTAPEISDSYFVIASDYYSFGCTIATLYKGEHIYQRLIDSKNIVDVNIAMRREGLPLDCPDAESDLQELVKALAMPAETMRAGYDDVNLWLKNSSSFVSTWKDKLRHGYEQPSLGFNFEDKIYNDEAELTNAMLTQWDNAKRYLYRGLIAKFFMSKNSTLADKTISIVEGIETAQNHDLGLAMFLHYFNTIDKSKCPIYWCGKEYKSLSDISSAICTSKSDENNIIAMLKSKFLSWKFDNSKEKPGQDTIDAIKEIENITIKHAQLGYYAFMYRFATGAINKISTTDEIFKKIANKRDDWHKIAEKSINDDMMLANIIDLGFKNNVLKFKEGCTGKLVSEDSFSDLESFYLLFEGICEDKTFVREHYLQYGPQAYLYWIQQNLSLYSFNSSKAKEIEKQIKNIKISKKMSISEIWESLKSLRVILLNDFMKLFQNNYLLTYIGLHTNEDTAGITTKNTYAFFAGNFFGINVPVGYLKTIGCTTEYI